MSLPTLQQPAGLSSDTLDPPSQPHVMQDDQWSDTHDTAETDDERDAIEEVTERQDDLTIQPAKITVDKSHGKDASSTAMPEPPTTEEISRTEAETGSVHSLPVVQVTEPTGSAAATPRSVSSTYPASPTPSSLSTQAPSSLDRRTRSRLQTDVSAVPSVQGFLY